MAHGSSISEPGQCQLVGGHHNDSYSSAVSDSIFGFLEDPATHATNNHMPTTVKHSHAKNAKATNVKAGVDLGRCNQTSQISGEGHAHLFELLPTEDANLESPQPLFSDVDTCFEKFRDMVRSTAPGTFEQENPVLSRTQTPLPGLTDAHRSQISTFLASAYMDCCPSGSEAGSFSFLVFKYLVDSSWGAEYAPELLSLPGVLLPNILDPDGLQLLEMLEERYLAPSMPRTEAIHMVYEKLAKQVKATKQVKAKPVRKDPVSRSSAKLLMTGTLLEHDASLRLLIRGLWDCADWSSKRRMEFSRLRNERLSRQDDQPGFLSSEELLRGVSYRLSDQRLAQRLRKMWASLREDYWRTQMEADNLITACIQDHSLIPHVLDFLDLVPLSLLRAWIVSACFTRPKAPMDNQSGWKNISNIGMWFKILYRLDIRRDAGTGTDTQTSLRQFAFGKLVRAHYAQRYPASTVIPALLYCLLGHESFSGESSLDLSRFIEQHTPFYARKDHRTKSLNQMLTQLISELASQSLPNHGVLELMIPYIDKYKRFASVSDLLAEIHKSGTQLSNFSFVESYTDQIRKQVEKKSNPSCLGRDLALLEKLVSAQIALGASSIESKAVVSELKSRRFFNHILDRANDAGIVPLAYRKLTPDILKEAQGDLIHQFAYQYALDRTRSYQQNWRSIRYLHLYLKREELFIRPMFTRALVSVCITRPLSENRFVPRMMVVWLCKLVADVEGQDVARQLEKFFWVTKGHLITQAKRDLERLGSADRAHVNTMKRLMLLSSQQEEDDDTQGDDAPYS